MKLVLFVFALIVSLSMAGNQTFMNCIIGNTIWQGTDAETVYWSQLPTGGTMPSQKFTDHDSTEADCGVADDFVFSVTTTINKIRWWGGYWNPGPGPVDCSCQIYLYVDDGTGNAPTLPEHSSAINYWVMLSGEYTEAVDGGNFVYEYAFPTWVIFDADQHYWIEIRKVFPLSPLGQWGWIQSEPVQESPSVHGTIGFGKDAYWTAQTTDAAFELIFDDELQMERSTWAGIKTIY